MATVLAEGNTLGDIIKHQFPPIFSQKLVTVASGAGVLKKGTVLGTVTASGKMVPYDPTSGTGPQLTAIDKLAILAADIDASAADVVKVPVYWALCGFSTAALIWGAGVTTQNHKDLAYAGLGLRFAMAMQPA